MDPWQIFFGRCIY